MNMNDVSNSTVLFHPQDPQDQLHNLQQSLGQLLMHNEFVDCTLCCKDGQVQAHRVVLALASTYIHNTFLTSPWPTPCSHPILFFKSSSTEDMKTALKFIYTGRTQVEVKKLPKLMDIARDLECTYLIKAVEKACMSCGIELFRQKVMQSSSSDNRKRRTTPPPSSKPFKASRSELSSTNSYAEFENSEKYRNDEGSSLEIHNTNSSTTTELVNSQNITESIDLPLSPKDIKTEAVEDAIVDIDVESFMSNTNYSSGERSSVERTNSTFSATGSNSNPASVSNSNPDFFPTDEHQITGFQSTQKGQNLGRAGTLTTPNINASFADTSDRSNEFEDFEDHEDQELLNDEEEQNISVVDLKSLAEPTINSMKETVGLPFPIFGANSDITSVGEQPASCPWCSQIFTSSLLLQKHIKTHIGTYKPFSCPYCSTSFGRSAHLKRHIRTHTGEKPFVCTVCDKAFSRQDKLKIHLQRHMEMQSSSNQIPANSSINDFSNGANTVTNSNLNLPLQFIRPMNKSVAHGPPKSSFSSHLLHLSRQRTLVSGRNKGNNFNVMKESQPLYLQNFSSEEAECQQPFGETGNVVQWHVHNESPSTALDGNAFNPILVSTSSMSPSTTITPVTSAPT